MDFFEKLLTNRPPPTSDKDRAESTAQVVEDYFQLLKHIFKTLHRTDKPSTVVVDEDSPFLIKVGDEEFCLDEFVCHDDEDNTERRMEIEALCSDGVSDEDVQRLLNEKIDAEW